MCASEVEGEGLGVLGEEQRIERERERVSIGEGHEERWHDRDKRATTEKTTQERAGALSSRDTLLFYETTGEADRTREILEGAFTLRVSLRDHENLIFLFSLFVRFIFLPFLFFFFFF